MSKLDDFQAWVSSRPEAAKATWTSTKTITKQKWEQFKAWVRERWRKLHEKLSQPLPPKHGRSDDQNKQKQKRDTNEQQEEQQEETQTARYTVQTRDGEALGTHFELEDAVREWHDETKREGVIIDLETGEDVTPEDILDRFLQLIGIQNRGSRQLFNKDQVNEEMGRLSNRDFEDLSTAAATVHNPGLRINPDLVMRYIASLNNNRRRLDFLEASQQNISQQTTTVEVPIRVKRSRKVPRPKATTTMKQTKTVEELLRPFPATTTRRRPIRDITEMRRLANRRDLALPRQLLARRIALGEVDVVDHYEEVETVVETPVTTTETEWVDEDYWSDEITTQEVTRVRGGQVLYILFDLSPSMEEYSRGNLGAAAANLVIGSNLDNDSRYFYRAFAGFVGGLHKAETREEKLRLTQLVLRATNPRVMVGTDIRRAMQVAVRDIRDLARKGEKAEIVLISDGESNLSLSEVGDLLGTDVRLHSVMLASTNWNLRAVSSTYVELRDDYGDVRIST